MLIRKMIYHRADVILAGDFQPRQTAIPIASAIWGSTGVKTKIWAQGGKKKLNFGFGWLLPVQK